MTRIFAIILLVFFFFANSVFAISEKEQLKKTYREYYLERVKGFESLKKYNNAIKVYEKLLMFGFVSGEEKMEISSKLAVLYGKVGKVREAMQLERK